MKMKKAILIGLAALLLAGITCQAQGTNLISDIGNVLGDVGLSSNPSNYAAAIFVGRSLTKNQTTAGLVVIENVNNNVGIAAGIDHLWGGGSTDSANIVAGGLTLKAATHPLTFLSSDTNSWTHSLTLTPYAIALVGTPINGTGNNGGLCAVNRAGANVDIYNFKGWELGAGMDYGNRVGAGNYSGNFIDAIFTIRKGF